MKSTDPALKEEMSHDEHLEFFERALDEVCYLREAACYVGGPRFRKDPEDNERAKRHALRIIAECDRREEILHANIFHHREGKNNADNE